MNNRDMDKTQIWKLINSKGYSVLQSNQSICEELSILNNDIQIISSLLPKELDGLEVIGKLRANDIDGLKEEYELTDMELAFVLECELDCLFNLEQLREKLTKYKAFLISINE